MTRLLAALAALTFLPAACKAPEAAQQRLGDVYLITALPLLFGEGFGIDLATADVVAAIERRARVKPVDLPSQVPPGGSLLIAQPRAFPAEELVALDRWVRQGGHLVLLADPLLEWPSERPLGDRLRPPVQFADTGLIAHWGLRLDAPDRRGPVTAQDGAGSFVTVSPGRLVRTGGSCALTADGIVATCRIGKGRAVIVADADWIDAPRMADLTGSPVDPGARLLAMLDSNPAR